MDKDKKKRGYKGIPSDARIYFTVLSMREQKFQRVRSVGTIVDVCEGGIEIVVDFPVQPGHVLQWDDRHKAGTLHTAIVKWSMQEETGRYRGGLKFL